VVAAERRAPSTISEYRRRGRSTVATRLNINVNDETATALQELAAKRGTTLTEVVRRAVSVYKFVEDEVVDGNKTLELKDRQSGERTTLAVL
jgi:hypothetical protein